MTATPAKLATRHRCINNISSDCARGAGKPRRKKCGVCGGALTVETGLYGVFVWRRDGLYPLSDALATYLTRPAAERYIKAKGDDRLVDRWVPVAPVAPAAEPEQPAQAITPGDRIRIRNAAGGYMTHTVAGRQVETEFTVREVRGDQVRTSIPDAWWHVSGVERVGPPRQVHFPEDPYITELRRYRAGFTVAAHAAVTAALSRAEQLTADRG